MKTARILPLLLIIIFIAAVSSCGGGHKQTRGDSRDTGESMRAKATGYAMIFDEDISLARDRATDDAKNELVKEVLGEKVHGTSMMENFELVHTAVEAESYGLVKNVKVLDEGKKGREYFITIEGTVEIAAVKSVIESALERYGKPRFMVLIEETFEGSKNRPGFTETETVIQDVMGRQGFRFVDARTVRDLMEKERAAMNRAARGNVDDDVQMLLMNTAGAEVMIVGEARTTDQSAAMKQYSENLKSKRANIVLRAIDIYTGNIISTRSLDAPGLDIDSGTASKKAIEAAITSQRGLGKDEPGEFTQQIIREFTKAATNRQINILITGLDYSNLRSFQNQVQQRIRGARDVQQRGQVGEAARLELFFTGKTHDFIDELQAKSGAMGYNVDVREHYPNRIVMHVTLR